MGFRSLWWGKLPGSFPHAYYLVWTGVKWVSFLMCHPLTILPHISSCTSFTFHQTGSHYSLDWTTGPDYWTHPKWCKDAFYSLFQCRSKANHVYSAYFFATFAPLACWANFTGVSRGQRSRAYLMRFNKELQPVTGDVKLVFFYAST